MTETFSPAQHGFIVILTRSMQSGAHKRKERSTPMHSMEIYKRKIRCALHMAHMRLTVFQDFQTVCCELWAFLLAEKVRQTNYLAI